MHQNEKRIPLADLVIRAIGGEGRGAKTRTARALGIDLAQVSRWGMPRSQKGTGGDVERWLKPVILELATEKCLDITPTDLVLGYRKVPA